jgi:hypothetical protein
MTAGTRDAPMTVPSIDGATTRDVRLQRDDAVVRTEIAVVRVAVWDVIVAA